MKIDIDKLKNIVGKENISNDIADLYVYASDASVHHALPNAIVRPKTIEQVQKIMRYANTNKIPIIPRGAGSGTSGHTVPIDGGIILDMKQMNKILEIRPEDMLVKVEPGVVDDDLNRDECRRVLFRPAPCCFRGGRKNSGFAFSPELLRFLRGDVVWRPCASCFYGVDGF